jgi:concanavalin A-like lectin/glucanase superfamily protein
MNTIKTIGKLPLIVSAALVLAANVEAQSSLSAGLLAYYPFSGNADDATGNGHDGVVTNAVLTTNRFGQADSAYAFNGSNSMIVVSNSADLQPLGDFSVSVWAVAVKAPIPPYQQEFFYPLLAKYSVGAYNSGWILQAIPIPPNAEPAGAPPTNGLWLTFQAPPPFNYFTTPHVNIPTNTWFQAVFTFQRTSGNIQVSIGTWHFYVNGLPADSGSEELTENNDPGPLIMGAELLYNTASGYRHFDGLLDDIRIYDRALSSNDVQQLYTEEAGPPVQPQVDTHKSIHLEFSNLTVGVQYQLQFSHNRHRWIDAGAPFTATAPTQSEYVDADHIEAHDVDWRLQIVP